MVNSDNCCGCGACSNICPKDAIVMETNEYGFIVPCIKKDICVGCNLCEKVCPQINNAQNDGYKQVFFAAYHKDVIVRQSSSSGGMFTALSDTILSKNGVVAGVSLDDDLIARHHLAFDERERNTFRKSKYVQSDTNTIYKQVKEQLLNNKMVLFTGVPCQVSALKLFLGKEYENLYTIDLLCHGVTSAQMFNDYIRYSEKKKKKKIIDYYFRDRDAKKGWEKTRFSVKYEDGCKEVIDARFDHYWALFYQNIAHRDSCFACKYKTMNRCGDITLGDFWGVDQLLSNVDTYNGVSLVAINTQKGHNLWNMSMYNIDSFACCLAGKEPSTMKKSNTPYKFRKQFFYVYQRKGFSKACFKYVLLYRIIKKIPLLNRLTK